MAAYAKVKLVTSVFHASDISFARGWSEAAPGYGGWNLALEDETSASEVGILPPGVETPAFVVTRGATDVTLYHRRPNGDREEIGVYTGLREALLTLCPLDEDALVDIQDALEEAFPRRTRRKPGLPR